MYLTAVANDPVLAAPLLGQSSSPCLVTGGAGFIGSHLVRLLLERGRAVRVLDLRTSKGLDPRAEFIQGSILNRNLVREVMGGVGHVFHLAAIPYLWAPDKRAFHAVNYEGTKIVLEEAERAGISRVVHTSTESILKGNCGEESQAADDRLCRLDEMPGPYCRSKFLAEQVAFSAAKRGLPVVIVNPTVPIGPGDYRLTPPTQMLIDFINGKCPAYLDFDINMIDVRDAALGHLLAAERGRLGERYVLGGQNLRLAHVLKILSDLTGLSMPRIRVPYVLAVTASAISEFVADVLTHTPPRAPLNGVRIARSSRMIDCGKAVREFGLPQSPAHHALAEELEWLFAEGHARSPFIKPQRTILRRLRPFDVPPSQLRTSELAMPQPTESRSFGL